jgi:hypothetical protein
MLLICSNETFGCAVLRVNKHDILWIAAWRVDCEEDDRMFQDLRLRVHRSAFEKEQLVAGCVIVRRRWLIDAEDARARRFSISEVVIHEQRCSRLGQCGGDFGDIESECVDGCLVHIRYSWTLVVFEKCMRGRTSTDGRNLVDGASWHNRS